MGIQYVSLLFYFLVLTKANNTCQLSCKQLYDCVGNKCVHKDLFPEWRALDIIGLLLFLISCILANVAGLGGGPFFMPICLLIFQFDLNHTVAISSAAIFGTQLIRFLISYWERHPKVNRPAIDYTIAALFSPSTILGTIFGALLNQWVPDWLTLILVVLLMTFNFYLILKKGVKLFINEGKIKKLAESAKKEQERKEIELKVGTDLQKTETERESMIKIEERLNPNLKALGIILKKDARPFPIEKLFYIVLSIAIATILTLLKGSKKSSSIIGVSNCSAEYWIISFAFIPISFILIYLIARISIRENAERIKFAYPFLETDLKLTKKVVLKLSIYGFFVGLLGSMLGIGGGIIVGPLFLEMKLDPTVSSYTSAFLAFFTAISSTIQYALWGQLVYDYSGFAIIFGIIGALIGIYGILSFVRKHSRPSIIVLTLACVLFLSCISMVYSGVSTIMEDESKGKDIWAFKNIC